MKTVILCYHKIGPESEDGRFLNCSPDQLDRHAKFFQRRGWNGFLPRQYLSQRSSGICFTFDDAYVSAVTHAPPILEGCGFRGAFYVVPSLVGLSSSWDGDQARPLAGWDELTSIADRGHELGNHTLTHPRLDGLPPSEQLVEIEAATKVMQARGIEVCTIAYPFGNYNDATFAAIDTAGIKVGLALGKRPVGTEPANCLPRIVVGYSDNMAKLLYKIYVRPKLP